MLHGRFARDEIKVTRQQICDSLHRLDPEGVEFRRQMRIQRIQ